MVILAIWVEVKAEISVVGTVVLYYVVGAVVGSLRVDPETETVGLDLAEHGEEGYTDQ